MAASPPPDSPTLSPAWLTALTALLGAERVSTRSEDRLTYARDMWTRGLLEIAARQPPISLPDAVLWPESAAELLQIVRLCRTHGVPMVAFGAGSGVSGAAVASGGVAVDMKRMRRLCAVDAERGVATFEPGLLGSHLEEQLNRHGLSLGHFPSSIMCSTAGGWLATRSAGQCSTKYGKIEDMVQELELVTGSGELLRVGNGDWPAGPDWAQLVVGSEGTLGFITRATCAVRRLPAARHMRGFSFHDVGSGCEAIRHLLQHGLRPAVVRLYDELDTLLSGVGRRAGAAADGPLAASVASPTSTMASDGKLLQSVRKEIRPEGPDARRRRAEERSGLEAVSTASPASNEADGPYGRIVSELQDWLQLLRPDAMRARGRAERWLVQLVLGQAQPLNRLLTHLLPRLHAGCLLILGFEGEPEITDAEAAFTLQEMARLGGRDLGEQPGLHWLHHRYDVSFKMPQVFAAGGFVDTIEVATTWDRLLPLYHGVHAALSAHALVLAHFSHAYPDGCSIYFTVIARADSISDPATAAVDARVRLAEDQRRYDTLWQAAMQATLRLGGTISHHHGIGRLKTPFMLAEHGASLALYSALKRACDPDALCNPGKLLTPPTAEMAPAPLAHSAMPASALLEALRARLGVEQVEETDGALRCRVHSAAEIAAVLQTAAAAGSQAACGEHAHVRLDLSALSQIGPLHEDSLVCEAQCGVALWRLEKHLRQHRLSLGGLPPWAWRRSLGAALAAPRLSEASLDAGRLRDRRLQMVAVLASGQEIVAPLQPSPRRAAGPDLGALLSGSRGELGVLVAATLRLSQRPTPARWAGFLLQDTQTAMRALGEAQKLHGACALGELLLASRELLARVLGGVELPPGRVALLAGANGPAAVAEAALRLLAQRVAAAASLPAALCQDFWAPAGQLDGAGDAQAAAHAASLWPAHEQALPQAAAERAALFDKLPGARLVCGVYLHGAALCSDVPAGATGGAAEPADAHTVLWPRCRTALTMGSAPRAKTDA